MVAVQSSRLSVEPRLPRRLAVWAQEGGLASRGFGRPICKLHATTVVRGRRGHLLHLVNTSALPADPSAQVRKAQALPMAFPHLGRESGHFRQREVVLGRGQDGHGCGSQGGLHRGDRTWVEP